MISTHGMRMTSAHYARMGTGECRRIHLATLEVLEQVGVDVHDSKALRNSSRWRSQNRRHSRQDTGIHGRRGSSQGTAAADPL